MAASLVYLFSIWGLVTVALIALLVYRSFLESREDDQIFISKSENHIEAEQRVIVTKVTRLGPPIKGLSIASGALLVVCVGLWLWSGLASL
jgi:hypothetical protein